MENIQVNLLNLSTDCDRKNFFDLKLKNMQAIQIFIDHLKYSNPVLSALHVLIHLILITT